jgi:hypothetical protein
MDDLVLSIAPESQRPRSLPDAGKIPPILVLFIVTDSAKSLREHVKWWGDIHAGVVTQVLVRSMLVVGTNYSR